MTPAVSILMPVCNEARFLPAALRSLTRQTCRDWELVAIDNGSTDATARILAEAAVRDTRVRPLTLPAPDLVAALNAGLAACRAPLVARMDGDDICHPQRLEKQIAALQADASLGLVACRVRHFPRPQLTDGMRAYETWQNALLDHAAITAELFVESPFTHPSICCRSDLLRAVGGYRACGWPEDYDLWLRLAAAGVRFGRLPETLFYWRDRPERLTRSCSDYTLAAFRTCKIAHLKEIFLRDCDQVTLWGAGLEGKAWREALAAAGIVVARWIEVDPGKLGQTIHGAPVCPPEALHPNEGKTLITIGARRARPLVRAFALQAGLSEGRDFVCVT